MQQCTREDASQLLSIVDTSKEVIRSLQNLDLPLTGFADSIFVYSIIQKLDPATRSWWERGLEDDRIPTIDELLKFITHHARAIQQQSNKIFSKPRQPSVPSSGKPVRVSSFTALIKSQCSYCTSNDHAFFQCSKFKDLTTLQRKTFVKENRLCYNCLKNHKLANYSSKFTCRVCHKKHNTLLHFESTNSTDNARVLSPHAAEFVPGSVNEPTSVPQQTLTNVSSCVSHQYASIQVLLCTAIVKVLDYSNQFQQCRVLLDPGSQACFVTESCFYRLGLSRTRARVEISCLGSSSAHTNGVTNLKFTPHFKESPEFITSAFIINKIIGDIPHFSLPSDTAAPFRDLKLADPNFFQGFIREYLALQHMKKVPVSEKNSNPKFYLPMQCLGKAALRQSFVSYLMDRPSLLQVCPSTIYSIQAQEFNQNLFTFFYVSELSQLQCVLMRRRCFAK
ncbi:hypothetical protein JTE90_012653 [Oedothorax gibbosus]|uniref:Peptidase aspartic putative domain-containing protein n=1 Tax=Oedothorax gibbosus TaxID=931172 RepID=A0AAV6TNC5_9ARAC|nr:hypothetical protein JTE90_012653 [Oedothorax gibbosus]